MHLEQQHFVETVKWLYPQLFTRNRVLEVGSLNINGSVRQYFNNCAYTGIDVAPGPGVDVVCQGQDFADPDDFYDVVISCECMEHNPFWEKTFENMHRLVRPKGAIIMTFATTGRAEHGTNIRMPGCSPLTLDWNYYRNLTVKDFDDAFPMSKMFHNHTWRWEPSSYDLYFLGFKQDLV